VIEVTTVRPMLANLYQLTMVSNQMSGCGLFLL